MRFIPQAMPQGADVGTKITFIPQSSGIKFKIENVGTVLSSKVEFYTEDEFTGPGSVYDP